MLGDGHPVEIMDLSFAVQALTLCHLVRHAPLPVAVHPVPPEIDEQVARIKLETLGITFDELSEKQREYLGIT